ncbi:ATP-binding protein [Sulfurospirillum sp. T05]|uniref:ATP-binding protein n=1 Tax=Sulfurospirillum tamanense TaxID=2813362 RepID=A0ABS2WRQ1_9BACT|nr:ATP-binding protein [Sulfurospirillum tamanensis]MBN2963894.1 ATP-binding protein [Sulfurospirillum tamanensis]
MSTLISWEKTQAAIWRPKKQTLRPVREIDAVRLEDLVGMERQKEVFLVNVEQFLAKRPFNHVLLWGARGTGKSSLVKALLCQYADQGLRLIEFSKEDLKDLPEVVDELRELPYWFVVFCDDFSFEEGDTSYKGLKPVLEGSIESPPCNVMVCATSNRRHLVAEHVRDNVGTRVLERELHYSDAVEEKISLSDRFGLWLSFYQGTQQEYLDIVEHYFKDYQGDKTPLHLAAKQFAASRASRSGRTAKQFYNAYASVFLKKG